MRGGILLRIGGIALAAASEIVETVEKIKEEQLMEFIVGICNAKKVYTSGAGRSLLVMRCIAMRLMHLGLESYVVGDTTTPAFEKGDLLIVATGSGETEGLVHIAKKVKKLGGTLGVITISKESSLGKMADYLIEIPAYTAKVNYENRKRGILPSGSLFEESVLVLGDSLIVPLADKFHVSFDEEFPRHANLE